MLVPFLAIATNHTSAVHAVIACYKSRALRHALREDWGLPPEKVFRYTGRDWLQVLLDGVTPDMRAKILLLLWRCWHLRDDCVHGDGKETIRGSVFFLQRYEDEWKNPTLKVLSETDKVETTLATVQPRIPGEHCLKWLAPAAGWAKINSDAAYIP